MIGRYALFDVLAAGGMATVHIGRLLGPVGFARTVAIKRLHPQYARDPEFVSMFLDEARMCARIRHPNVVPTLDVVATQGELFLVMDYVQGESLAHLIRAVAKRGDRIPWRIAISIMSGCLHGLHAAHEAKDERGLPLGLVHRDVSPQNVLIGVDGMARVLDFGIAKATGRFQTTREGAVKGKLGYMAPEQMAAEGVTRQADVYAAAVVLWEALSAKRCFDGDSEAVVLARVLTGEVLPPSSVWGDIPAALDEVVLKGMHRDPAARFQSAREFAQALEKLTPAAVGEVGEWIELTAQQTLEDRARKVAEVEEGAGGLTPAATDAPPPLDRSAATGGSIRPTAMSEHGEPTPLPARAAPRWLVPAVGAGALLLALGIWAAVRGGEPAAAGSSAAATLAQSAPTGGVAASGAAGPVASDLPSAAASAPQSTSAAGAEASAEPSASSSAKPKPSGKLPGVLPTSKTGSPWSLGGRQ